jgi:hypothetical protein
LRVEIRDAVFEHRNALGDRAARLGIAQVDLGVRIAAVRDEFRVRVDVVAVARRRPARDHVAHGAHAFAAVCLEQRVHGLRAMLGRFEHRKAAVVGALVAGERARERAVFDVAEIVVTDAPRPGGGCRRRCCGGTWRRRRALAADAVDDLRKGLVLALALAIARYRVTDLIEWRPVDLRNDERPGKLERCNHVMRSFSGPAAARRMLR